MKKFKDINLVLIFCPLLLISISYLTLLSTSRSNAQSQLLFFIIGSAGYTFFAIVDVHIYKFLWQFLQFGIFLLLCITFALGTAKFGSTRWIDFGFFTFQPSEFAKITTIISLASIIYKTKDAMKDIKIILISLLSTVPIIFLVLIQPDLGTALVLLACLACIFFYCGINKWFFVIAFLALAVFSTPAWHLLKDYQRSRILVFLNPTLDTQGAGYNVIQSIVTVGSGGIFGKGFGRGTQAHLGFLPAFFTDFALASYVEEWGFVGFFALILIYTIMLLTILYTSYNAESIYSSIIALGIFIIFLLQFIVNVGMNLGIMPVKGIPLPLFSYGGSSMLSSMFMLGVVQNIWMQKKH